jgi:hypothetical protein
MACARFVTRLPDPPDRNVPRFISCMARSTFFEASRREADGFILLVAKVPPHASGGQMLPALDMRLTVFSSRLSSRSLRIL